MRFGMFCVTAYVYMAWVRMSQNLVSMWLSAKNNYSRGLTIGFYHCATALKNANQKCGI
jgi:hypothetical protein